MKLLDEIHNLIARQTLDVKTEGGNYAYINARLKSRSAKLLKPGDYETLLGMSVNEIGVKLGESQYGKELNALGLQYKGVDLIEHALAAILSKEMGDIYRFCQGGLREIVSRRLLLFDAENLKAVLRARANKVGADEVKRSLVPIEFSGVQFNLAKWIDLHATEDDAAFIKKLADTPFEKALSYAWKSFSGSGTPDDVRKKRLILELEMIDLFSYNLHIHAVTGNDEHSRLLKEIFSIEADTINLHTFLMLLLNELSAGDIVTRLLSGARFFTPDKLEKMAALPSFHAAVAELRKSQPYPELDGPLETAEKTENLLPLDRELKKLFMRKLDGKAQLYPLTALTAISYIKHRWRECENIRIIARGKSLELPEPEIRELLLIVARKS